MAARPSRSGSEVVARPSRSGSEADEPEEHEKPQDAHQPALPDRDGLATLQSASRPSH